MGAIAAPMLCLGKGTGRPVKIKSIEFSTKDYQYRTPLKFGGTVVDRVTLLNVDCTIEGSGKVVKGMGSMPMGNVWSFPSRKLTYDQTLEAMRQLAVRIQKITNDYKEAGHPIEINVALEPLYLRAAEEVTKELKLSEPIPHLCTLTTASPFDAAIHDAYGKLFNMSAYQTNSEPFIGRDLSSFIGNEFKGEYLDRYTLKAPKASMPLYHLVGAVDPVTEADIKHRINDGLPETLPEWIQHNGLTNIKIKLNGDDLKWDVDRVLYVERVAAETQKKRGVSDWVYSLDFNERAPNVDYLIGCLRKIKEGSAEAFRRVQYVEQPTKRDLKSDRANVMHEAAKLKPVVIDESLTSKEMLMLAREMGYTGTALKACKGQTQALLMAAVAQKYKMFLCVQDLTCPGASLIHSAGLAAHVPGVAAIEANARQYVPVANAGWEKKFPSIFIIKDGKMGTGVLNRPGLSAT